MDWGDGTNKMFLNISGACRADANVETSTVFMPLANHNTPFDVDVVTLASTFVKTSLMPR